MTDRQIHDEPPTGYRPGVGIMLFNEAGRVFVANRIDTPEDAWQMPQGGIDRGESPKAAALRELVEEVGTDKVEIVGETRGWFTYEVPDELQGARWASQYRGQAMKWFAARFTGSDSDIDLATHSHAEFSDWAWVPLEDIIRLIVPFKRELYEAVVEELRAAVRSVAAASG